MAVRTKNTAKTATLWQQPDGQIQALSSNGHTIYAVDIGPSETCTCAAGYYGLRCYHLKTAEREFPAFWPIHGRQTADIAA